MPFHRSAVPPRGTNHPWLVVCSMSLTRLFAVTCRAVCSLMYARVRAFFVHASFRIVLGCGEQPVGSTLRRHAFCKHVFVAQAASRGVAVRRHAFCKQCASGLARRGSGELANGSMTRLYCRHFAQFKHAQLSRYLQMTVIRLSVMSQNGTFIATGHLAFALF
uniref:Uncharacterized protein n=1 Tax=Rhipicephalus pulchellus TaxID=72859 RepID=L7LUA7_RHIPC